MVRDTIEHNDALRLRDDGRPRSPSLTRDRSAKRPNATVLDFGADETAERVARLRNWLGSVLDYHLVEPVADSRAFDGAHWTSPYVSRAFAAGVSRGGTILRQSGYTLTDAGAGASDLIRTDPYRSAVRERRYLTYNDVRHAAEVARTKATREIAGALSTDLSPRAAADMLVDRIDKVGRSRTDTTAETRIIDTYNRALAARYQRVGVERVGVVPEAHAPTDAEERSNARSHAHTHGIDRRHVQGVEHRHDHGSSGLRSVAGAAVAGAAAGAAVGAAASKLPSFEWTTAGDDRVCERCRKRAGKTYRLRDLAKSSTERPPIHPRCRCLLRPA